MSGAAASESILFIGAIVAAAGLVAALMGTATALQSGLEERAELLALQMEGRIDIVNDPLYVETSPLTLYVKNTGSTTFYAPKFVIIVDGQPSADWTTTVDGAASDTIKPGELATMTVNDLAVGAGDHRVVVVSDQGQQDDLEFTA